MKAFKYFMIFSLFAFMLIGCTKDLTVPFDLEDMEFSFSDDIQPILENKCSGCHKHAGLASADPYGFMTSESWITADTTKAKESKLYEKLQDPNHVGGKITTVEKRKLELWMEQGALNN